MRKLLREHENGFLFTQAIFTILGLFMTAYTLLSSISTNAIIVSLILYILFALYTCWAYKKPHGNYLRIMGILLAASIIYTGLTVVSPIEEQISNVIFGDIINNYLTYLFILSACGVAYVAGRLDKYKSNSIVLIISIALLVISVSAYQGVITATLDALGRSAQVKFAIHLASYNPPILVTTFTIAYLTRYESHINSGIEKDLKVFNE